MKYIETFSDARSPPRRIWNNLPEAVRDVEKYGKFSNVSISIWWYRDIEKKYYGNGSSNRFLRMGAKYGTAITDKLFFDIDCLDKNGKINGTILSNFHSMWQWAMDNNIRRQVSFTGGGFQALLNCKVRPENYEGVYYSMKDKFNIVKIDKSIPWLIFIIKKK